MNKKIYFLGDFYSDNGPGIANRDLRDGIKNIQKQYSEISFFFSENIGKIEKVFEIIYHVFWADIICICNYTRMHLLAISLAQIFGKKCFYRLHGYTTFETKINSNNIKEKSLKKINRIEKYIFRNSEKIICVSKTAAEFMKKQEPLFEKKFVYCFNTIKITDFFCAQEKEENKKKNLYTVISVGGGMPRKNNLYVARAINKIKNKKIKYLIVGEAYTQKEELCAFDFVEYIDFLKHDQLLEKMKGADLYIQNSSFETFGLAALEAFYNGCSLLLSKKMGAIEIFKALKEEDLIVCNSDLNEIANKIESLLEKQNHKRLQEQYREELLNVNNVVEKFLNIVLGESG